MGKIVFAGAMSHVLDPDYYDAACGPVGRRKVEDVMEAIRQMGARLAARSPDALIVVADDHLNAFSFNAVPALCVRIGTTVSRMVQEDAEAFDKVLEDMPLTYPLHEELANQILEQGLASGFDLALSWEAPLDHAFLSPVTTLFGTRPILRGAGADQSGGCRVEGGVSRYAVNSLLYRLKKDREFRARFSTDPRAALADADLTEAERAAFLARDMRRINELGGYLHLVLSIPGLAVH